MLIFTITQEVTAVSWKQMMVRTARLEVVMTAKSLQKSISRQINRKTLSCRVFSAKCLNVSAFTCRQQLACDGLWFLK